MARGNGNLIIGGQTFKIDAPLVNWRENGWDATAEVCIPTVTEPAPKCVGGVPYGPSQ